MTARFRKQQLFTLLDSYERRGNVPLDQLLSSYFRAHKAIGSKDRQWITQRVYDLVRWRRLYAHVAHSTHWSDLDRAYEEQPPSFYLNRAELPLAVRVSFPDALFDLLVAQWGEERAVQLCLDSNTQAPTTIRVNTLKSSRERLLARWQGYYPVAPTPRSQEGIIFSKRINFYALPEFKEGLFELQDEGSQLVAQLLDLRKGDELLDFCAGAGGKSLACAPRLHGSGQLYLHDLRPSILLEAKKRLKRAGVQNAQIVLPGSRNKELLKGRMNWVLADVPCTGTGTLRRNPDIKWKFSLELLARLQEQQRAIVAEALHFAKPGGKLVYATCSLLREENQEQVAYFERTHPLKLLAPPFYSLPTPGGMDGFFAAVFQRVEP